MHYFNIGTNYNFLESLYRFIGDSFGNSLDISDLVVVLPNRRSVNALKMVFLKNSGNVTRILPIMRAIGDIDSENILLDNAEIGIFHDYLKSTKTTSYVKYKLLLLSEILSNSEHLSVEQAIGMAKELDIFLSDAEKYEISFDNLNNIVDDDFAIHWQQILNFLKNFGSKWQNLLNENNLTSIIGSIINNIKFYTKIFEQSKPKNPIVLAGNFSPIKSTMKLIRTLAKYDNTYLLFKGLENIITEEEFNNIDEFHSHFYLKTTLKELAIDRKQVKNVEYPECRTIDDASMDTLYNALLPSDLTYRWQNNKKITELKHVKYIECNDIYDEFNVIIIYLLNYIAKNGLKNIAVISSAEQSYRLELFLKHWNLPYNNVYGRKFIFHGICKYLFLIIDTYNNNYRQDNLLSLLKNNFTRFGYLRKKLLENIELFEKNVLVDKINRDGIESYRKNIENIQDEQVKHELISFLDTIEEYFSVFKKKYSSLDELMVEHLGLAERIATSDTDENDGLWNSDKSSEKIFEFFNDEIIPQANCFNHTDISDYGYILNFLISDKSYNYDYSINPAINIISPQEAQLINYDLVVVTNLNDGVFPANISADPWMNRKMRADFGLPAREVEIGKSYFDLLQLMAHREVVLTRSRKVDGMVSMKSRFLQRLESVLSCNNLALQNDYALSQSFRRYYNYTYDESNNAYKKRPQPKPPRAVRPQRLSATNIDLLSANPYDIYVKKVLHLTKNDIIGTDDIYAKIGTLVHSIFEQYCRDYDEYKRGNHSDVTELVRKNLSIYFADNQTLMELYFDKIVEIVRNFLVIDEKSRDENYSIVSEDWNSYVITNRNNFTISAKIDRIEALGRTLRIIDYKTGTAPSKSDVVNGKKLQLPIEALILAKNKQNMNVTSLQYWIVKHKNSKVQEIQNGEKMRNVDNLVSIDELAKKTEELIIKLIDFFSNEANAYLATNRNAQYSDFIHLSRVEEWLYESAR
ncbi:double-strand break repair protein AddB [Bacilli bacterium]|nr:double-strand break repair protein AddB [Bacilli bacterium]